MRRFIEQIGEWRIYDTGRNNGRRFVVVSIHGRPAYKGPVFGFLESARAWAKMKEAE